MLRSSPFDVMHQHGRRPCNAGEIVMPDSLSRGEVHQTPIRLQNPRILGGFAEG